MSQFLFSLLARAVFDPPNGVPFTPLHFGGIRGTSRMENSSNKQAEVEAEVLDIHEPTNLSGSNAGSQTTPQSSSGQPMSATTTPSPFANLGPNPFSGNASNRGPFNFDPSDLFGTGAPGTDADGQPRIPLTLHEDMEKLAKFLASTTDGNEVAKVMEDFLTTHPNLKPEALMVHFPAKMNTLIEKFPPMEKFPKLMLMLNAFAAVDPVIGKTLESLSLGPMTSNFGNQSGEEFFNADTDTTPQPQVDQFDDDFLITDRPFNEGLDDLDMEELKQLGLGELGNMSLYELMDFAMEMDGAVSNLTSNPDQQPKQ